MTRKLCLGIALVLAVLLVCAGGTVGQEVTASITGTVTDQSGGAVVGATVTAKDTARGTSSSTKTTTDGVFYINRIPVGTYDVKVEASGFQSALQPGIVLVLNQTARLEIQLKVGQTTQIVEVNAAPPVLQTDTTQVSTIIDARTNDNLPLATRNYVQLTLLSPGSITPNPGSFNTGDNTGSGGRPYINGNREQSNNFLLDGMDNNQVSDNLLGYTPAPDAIEEFNLITNNASAEFGNFQGGIVSATIKSGTNSLHGDVWEFFRNDILNAKSWQNNFNGTPKDKLRWNMFGGTLGGPVLKNKLFFFVDYQGQRFDHPSSSSLFTTYTTAEKNGDFSVLCGAGFNASGVCTSNTGHNVQLYNPCAAGTGFNGVPCTAPAARQPFAFNQICGIALTVGQACPAADSMISPVAKALFASSLFPATINNNLQQNALNTTTSELNSNQGDVKIDYVATSKDRISWRFTRAQQNNPSSNSQPLFANGSSTAPIWNTVGDWTRAIRPNLLNDFRLGWSHITLNTGSSFVSSVGALGNTIGIGNGNPSGIDGLLGLGLGGILSGLGNSLVTQSFDDHVWQVDDSLIYTRGRHSLKFGFQFWHEPIKTFYSGNNGELGFMNFNGSFTASAFQSAATNTGDGSADFFLGLPGEFGRGLSSGKTWEQTSNIYGAYAQDTWRVTNRLTINLGLRYEAHTPWVETHDQQTNFDLKTQQIVYAGQNGASRALYNGVYGGKDFQPRIGFAWTPEALGGHTVVRGAFTISSYLEGTGTNLRLPINPPFNPAELDVPYNGVPLPATTASDGIVGSTSTNLSCPNYSCFAGALLRVWDPNVQPAISDQWNLTVQRQFWKDTTFQIGYVGQRGTHLMVPFSYSQRELLAPSASCPAPCTAPSPFFSNNAQLLSTISKFTSGTQSNGTMDYNALQAVMQRQMSNGLQYQVAYTYSKCMTNNSGYYGSWGAQATTASPYWQNIYDPKAEWAPCFYDATHSLTAYSVYELPIGRGKKFGKDMNAAVNAVVGGWTISPIISLHTGFPMSPYGTSDKSGTNSRSSRPNCNSIAHVQGRVPGAGFGGYQYFTNNGNFSDPAAGTFGTCPAQLGWLRGPGYDNWDLSLQKNVQITERYKVQFRTDFVNAFNHVNLNAPDMGFGGTMGQITSAQDPRNIQFALKFYY
jgi:Carboxypeptidase regulatory-like domain